MVSARSSSASWRSCLGSSLRRSAGSLTVSSRRTGAVLAIAGLHKHGEETAQFPCLTRGYYTFDEDHMTWDKSEGDGIVRPLNRRLLAILPLTESSKREELNEKKPSFIASRHGPRDDKLFGGLRRNDLQQG